MLLFSEGTKGEFGFLYNELTIVSWLEGVQGIFPHNPSGCAFMAIKNLFMVQSIFFPMLKYMSAAQVSASSCLCALLGTGLATIEGILIDDILLPAEGKKNDDLDNCYKLTGGPSGSARLQFSFFPSLANSCVLGWQVENLSS